MNDTPRPINVKTMPYPGFPTDMQPQICTLIAISKGTGMIIESIWESRFQYTDELIKMGADITAHDSTAMGKGLYELEGCPVRA